YAKGSGELSGAISAAVDVLCGTSQEDVLDYMKELKAMTPEKLRKYADVYRKLVEDGMMFTAGGSAAVNANLDLYDAVLNPFGAVDATQTEFEDVPEGHAHYEAVRFVFEEMIMDPLGETVFGVDEKATVGELSGALYALIGGDYTAQQESIDFFAQYGIIGSGTSASEVLTGKAADSILSSFSAAVSVPYKSDKSLTDKPLTRGELAEIIMAYTLPLIEE
ncbi:MAG: hypothetical protein II689_00705, partial [Firmicutes bacterium]|nr:hypothetical protein [Bacillota bacterium]